MWAEGTPADQWILMTATMTPWPGDTTNSQGTISLYLDDGTKYWTWVKPGRINTGSQGGDNFLKIGKFQYRDLVNYPEATYSFIATNTLTAGKKYKIMVKGNTNWTLLGAANNDVGTVFTKNSTVGTGTGRACEFKVLKLNGNGTGSETQANGMPTPMTSDQFNGHEGLNGSVGMVTMYNRVLTPTEIRQYYFATKKNYKG
jgi:hypothetical protein